MQNIPNSAADINSLIDFIDEYSSSCTANYESDLAQAAKYKNAAAEFESDAKYWDDERQKAAAIRVILCEKAEVAE
ncbi:hypothetical protein MsAg5_10240 [Methanosarcinaceae archaeon Ag5]|uniref:Uncharacterized protein n=1 Tax=Methanolapillus africanus TaxID=3028297 RepID=A0AAE4MK71_9EURY|nr:hypothetical protein [Methanosarcinaceae archaeon Ag5]